MLDKTSNPLAILELTLERQRIAHKGQPDVTAEVRIDRLNRALALLVTHRSRFESALSDDFGHRSADLSSLADIGASTNALQFARKHVRSWMKPSRRRAEFPLGLAGAKAFVQYQPKGVVGVMAPWNFPVSMVFAPLACVLAAGNRAMVKPSEFTPHTSELLQQCVTEAFDEDELAVVCGGADVGAAFSGLAFDHLLFTGSSQVGRHVMRAASENLVPVTLELGGKSPALIGESADLMLSARRIMNGKTFNAGQVCVSPDYVLVSEDHRQEFVTAAGKAIEEMFPDGIKRNPDYTSMLGERHYDRMQSLLEDARSKGATVVTLNPKDEELTDQDFCKVAPTLVLDVTPDMAVMQEEIFGPILPIATYSTIENAIAAINSGERPLALYYFGKSKAERNLVLNKTVSGGVTVNDTLMQVTQDDLPFGGVGDSGMGRYHGRDGFLEFSHQKGVFVQSPFDVLKPMRPPYGKLLRAFINSRIKA